MASPNDFYEQTVEREKFCSQRSTETMVKWFVGTGIALSAATGLAHQFYAPFRRVNWRFKFIPAVMATLGTSAYQADVELCKCRREMHQISFEADRKRRAADFSARQAQFNSQQTSNQQ